MGQTISLLKMFCTIKTTASKAFQLFRKGLFSHLYLSRCCADGYLICCVLCCLCCVVEFVRLADLPCLADLVFVGNPLEEKHSAEGTWMDEASKRLPNLRKLDGKSRCFSSIFIHRHYSAIYNKYKTRFQGWKTITTFDVVTRRMIAVCCFFEVMIGDRSLFLWFPGNPIIKQEEEEADGGESWGARLSATSWRVFPFLMFCMVCYGAFLFIKYFLLQCTLCYRQTSTR